MPVVAGADGSLGGYRDPPSLCDLDRYWPEPVAPGAALDLLAWSVEMGATIVGVGPWTNLALLEVARPGLLASTRLVVMGGYVRAVRAGLPAWELHTDYNVQQDTLAARIVWERCDPLVVQLSATLEATLREAHLRGANTRHYPTTSSTSTTRPARVRGRRRLGWRTSRNPPALGAIERRASHVSRVTER